MIAFVCEYKYLFGYSFGLYELIASKLSLTWIVLGNNHINYRIEMGCVK